jgi:hypothetical protein
MYPYDLIGTAVLLKSQDARLGCLHGYSKAQFRKDMSRTWKNLIRVIQATCVCYV